MSIILSMIGFFRARLARLPTAQDSNLFRVFGILFSGQFHSRPPIAEGSASAQKPLSFGYWFGCFVAPSLSPIDSYQARTTWSYRFGQWCGQVMGALPYLRESSCMMTSVRRLSLQHILGAGILWKALAMWRMSECTRFSGLRRGLCFSQCTSGDEHLCSSTHKIWSFQFGGRSTSPRQCSRNHKRKTIRLRLGAFRLALKQSICRISDQISLQSLASKYLINLKHYHSKGPDICQM